MDQEKYKVHVRRKLVELTHIFSKACKSNFSKKINFPVVEDEFSDVYLELDNMLDCFREKMLALESQNKKLEDKKTDEMFHLAVEAAPNSMIMIDKLGKIIMMNSKTGEMFGYRREELLDKNIKILIPAHLKVLHKEIRNVFLNSSKAKQLGGKSELRGLNKNGNEIPIEIELNPIKTEKGIYVLVSIIDLTNRKKYEADLNNLAKFPAEDPSPVLRFSVHGQVLMYANKAAKELVSFFDKPENKEVKAKWLSLLNVTFLKKKVEKSEFQIGKQIYLFTIVPIVSESYINVYASDITRVKEAEQEVKKLSFAMNKTDNAIIIADRKGRIEWVNEGFTTLNGFEIADVKGSYGEILRKGKMTGLNPENHFFKKMIKEMKSVSYQSRNWRKDGREYWSLSTLTPILNDNAEIENIVVMDADITMQKQWEKELITAKKMAEDSARAKQAFLANMSHEIRTPMNAIIGMSQLLQDTELTPLQKEYLASINFAGENLLHVINDVLDISKIESGKIGFEKIEFNLKTLVKDLINTMGYTAKEKNIDFIINISKAIPEILIGDPIRLNQIIINLVSNAIKFTDKGYIKLSAKVEEQSASRISLRFDVKDTGIGIPKEKLSEIFEAFEQAHKETTRKYGGSGLGLAIVKRLINMQGGTISVKSKLNMGSTFSFLLNYEIGTPTNLMNIEKTTDDTRFYLTGKEVLLVEDNKLNQMVADRFLKAWGINVTISNNGLEAIKTLRKNNFDVVLMDIQMPEMDGYETTEYIREKFTDSKKDIPIIAMTAHALGGEEQKCINYGMNEYISKPINRQILQSKLMQVLTKTI